MFPLFLFDDSVFFSFSSFQSRKVLSFNDNFSSVKAFVEVKQEKSAALKIVVCMSENYFPRKVLTTFNYNVQVFTLRCEKQ